MQHLGDLLAGAEVRLSDDVMDQIDQTVPPGTGVGLNEAAYNPPAILKARAMSKAGGALRLARRGPQRLGIEA